MKEICSKTKVLVGPPDLEIEEVMEMTVDEQETAITNMNIAIDNNSSETNGNNSNSIEDIINNSNNNKKCNNSNVNITIDDTSINNADDSINNSNNDHTMNLDTNNTTTQTLSAEPVQVFTNYSSLMNSFNEHEVECNTKYNIHHMKPGFEVDTNILSHYLNK